LRCSVLVPASRAPFIFSVAAYREPCITLKNVEPVSAESCRAVFWRRDAQLLVDVIRANCVRDGSLRHIELVRHKLHQMSSRLAAHRIFCHVYFQLFADHFADIAELCARLAQDIERPRISLPFAKNIHLRAACHHFTPFTCTILMSSSGSVPFARRNNLGSVPVLCTTQRPCATCSTTPNFSFICAS
jgi:hypothetical protein